MIHQRLAKLKIKQKKSLTKNPIKSLAKNIRANPYKRDLLNKHAKIGIDYQA